MKLTQEFHELRIAGHPSWRPIAGHPGWRKWYQAMSQHYYWPGMLEKVREYTTQCPVCQRTKKTNQPRLPLLSVVPARPFESITLVDSVSDKVVQVKLHASNNQVRDICNVIDVRPWLHSDRSLDVSYPAVAPHPALSPVVQVLDRKPYRRSSRVYTSAINIPCSILLCVRIKVQNGFETPLL
jgi:hypothetical protein